MTDSDTSVLWDSALDPLFRRAERLGIESAWWGHVPFANWLVKACQPKLIVELGTYSGVSYTALCEAALQEHLKVRCYAIDTWRGDEHAGFYGDEVFHDFLSFHNERYAAFSSLLRTTFDEAVLQFEDLSIDLLHLDGLHTYEVVKHDFEVWEPKLSEGAVLLLHDVNERQGNFGVWRLYKELAARFPAFEFLHDHGLGVIAVGRSAPDSVLELCTLKDERAISRVRERFAFLGDRWRSDMGEKKTSKLLAARGSEALATKQELTAALERIHAEAEAKEKLNTELSVAGQQLETLRLQHAEAINKAALATDELKRAKSRPPAETDSERRLRAQIATLDTAIAAANKSVADMRSKLETETSARSRAESARKDAAAQLSSLRSDLREAKDHLKRFREDHESLLHSRSWRLTAPLRKLAGNTSPPGRLSSPSINGQLEADAELLRQSSLFNSEWYLKRYPDVAEAGIDPALHYLTSGGSEGRHPSPKFDSTWYLEHHVDVAQEGTNPLLHYLQAGIREGREIRAVEKNREHKFDSSNLSAHVKLIRNSGLFDSDWYLKQYPDMADADFDPAKDYLVSGAREGRNPGPVFNTNAYLERHPELRDSGENALVHFLQQNDPADIELLRQVRLLSESNFFDPEWYKKKNPDVITAGDDPIWHYLLTGAAEGRNPGTGFDANWYLQVHRDVAKANLNPLLHYLEHGIGERREIRRVKSNETGDIPTVRDLLQTRSDALTFNAFSLPVGTRRLTLFTESIDPAWLYGRGATSLLLCVCLAKRLGASIRLVTREEPPENIDLIESLLSANGLSWSGNLEILHSSRLNDRQVPVSPSDIFLTTSWWTTRCVRATVHPSRIVYLLQEDERMLYPFGDERLLCEETLFDSHIQFVVDSQLLFEHLTTGSDALPGVAKGIWFEPAFPYSSFRAEPVKAAGQKRDFFFYARPLDLRNLYWRGLEGISSAIEAGLFHKNEWNFHFVGKSLSRVVLPNGCEPTLTENLQWDRYGELVRSMDVGLCLTDTPHPSYPPLDLAASGAVVVTNQRGLKTSLSRYSENILCVEPSKEGIAQGLKAAVDLANNEQDRLSNYAKSGLLRDWNTAFEPVLLRLESLFKDLNT